MAVPSALECLRCRRTYPVVPMPAGCPVCSEERFPTNVAPVYEKLPGFKSGKLSGRGLMRFLPQLPVSRDGLVSLGEGATPLLAVSGLGSGIGLPRLLVKDERRNPTGSWRDRYAAVALSQVDEAATTAGSAVDEATCVSIAAYAARAGVRSVGVVSPGVSGRARDAIDGVGGRTVAVDGAPEQWMLLSRAEQALGWRAFTNRTTPPIGGDPIATEGYKTIAYEIAEDLGFAAPGFVAVPAGLGDGVQGIWRGFRELAEWGVIERAPRMVAVEVAGAVAATLAGGKDWVSPSAEIRSGARSLSGITGTVQTLHAVTESEGLVVRVSDAELERARIQLGESEGVWADLAAAAPVAAAIKLAERGNIPADASYVAVVTEHGALDEAARAPGSLELVAPRVDDLLRVLAVRGD